MMLPTFVLLLDDDGCIVDLCFGPIRLDGAVQWTIAEAHPHALVLTMPEGPKPAPRALYRALRDMGRRVPPSIRLLYASQLRPDEAISEVEAVLEIRESVPAHLSV